MKTWQRQRSEQFITCDLAAFLSAGFLLDHVSVHSSEHHDIPDFPCLTLCFCLASVLFSPSSLTFCPTAASLDRRGFVWKVIGALCVSGCQLDEALRIIKSNNCVRVLWAVWKKWGPLVLLYDPCYLKTSFKSCGSAFYIVWILTCLLLSLKDSMYVCRGKDRNQVTQSF